MTDRNALTAPNQVVETSATLYSTRSLDAMLSPAIRRELDAAILIVPANMPHSTDLIAHLRRAAVAHKAALVPATKDEITRELAMLSTATIPWTDEDERKVKLGLEILKRGIAHLPLDILRDGIAAYISKPGRRFFPKSPGELLEFTGMWLRRRAAYAERLDRMADELERRAREEALREAEETGWTAEKIAEANRDLERSGVRTRYRLAPGGRCEHFLLEPTE